MTGENCLPGKWNDKFKIICFEITYIYFALLNGYIKLLTFQQVSGFVLIQLLSSFILSKITMKLSYVCLLNLCFHLSEINFFLISFNSVEFPDNLTLDSPFHKLTLSFFIPKTDFLYTWNSSLESTHWQISQFKQSVKFESISFK